jgi:iron complex transport system substrate-binding protein
MIRVMAVALLFLMISYCSGPPLLPAGQVRLVSLVPSVTEIVYALGAGGQLVGNTTSCDWPDAAREVTKVGTFYQPDVERIVSLRPDVVFLALPIHRPVAEKLGELGIRYHPSDPQSLGELLVEIALVGRLVERVPAAESLVGALSAGRAALPVWPDTPLVYVEISSAPLMTVGRGTFLDEVVRAAGGCNVYGNVDRQYPVVAPEDIVRLNPEVILLVHPASTPAEVRTRLGWSGVSAVRSGRVIADIDENLLVRPGPRSVEGIGRLGPRLHTMEGHPATTDERR